MNVNYELLAPTCSILIIDLAIFLRLLASTGKRGPWFLLACPSSPLSTSPFTRLIFTEYLFFSGCEDTAVNKSEEKPAPAAAAR